MSNIEDILHAIDDMPMDEVRMVLNRALCRVSSPLPKPNVRGRISYDGDVLDELVISGNLTVHLERLDDDAFHFSVTEVVPREFGVSFRCLHMGTLLARRKKNRQHLVFNPLDGDLTAGWKSD
jgi:hypothetical protein